MIELDCRRLLCPLPVIQLQNQVAELKPGDELVLIATDPGVLQDIPAWCRIHGHQICKIEQKERSYWIHIRVG